MTNTNGSFGNLKSWLIFSAYAQPATPSEIAQRLRLPANTVHYWTRKLQADGLLEVVETRGRSRRYQADEDALVADPQSVQPFVQNLLAGLNKLVVGATERWVLDGTGESARAPQVDIHELRLRASDVPVVVEAVKEALSSRVEELPAGEGEMFTLALVAVPGRLSEHS